MLKTILPSLPRAVIQWRHLANNIPWNPANWFKQYHSHKNTHTQKHMWRWAMTLIFSRVLEVVKMYVGAKFHQAKCSGWWVIVLTEKTAMLKTICTAVASAGSNERLIFISDLIAFIRLVVNALVCNLMAYRTLVIGTRISSNPQSIFASAFELCSRWNKAAWESFDGETPSAKTTSCCRSIINLFQRRYYLQSAHGLG